MESHLVEFAGLPGSGKTVVSQALAALLAARGVCVTTPSYKLDHRAALLGRLGRKLSYAVAGALRQPGCAMRCIGAVARSRQRTLGTLVSVSTNWLYLTESQRHRDTEPGVHIYDQGLLQALWSLSFEAAALDAAWPAFVALLEETLPRHLLVVILEADPALVGGRLQRRADGASRLDRDVSRRGLQPSLERAVAVFDRVAAEAVRLAASDRLSLLRVRNDGDAAPAAAAATITDFMVARLP